MNIRRLCFACVLCCALTTQYATAQEKGYFLHTVTKGQSLYSIAQTYNISVDDIVRLNPGSEQQINAGAILKIPQLTASNKGKTSFHTIEAGETLYRLTQKYGVTVDAICEANPGLSATNFKAGQVITIPARNSDGETVTTPVQPLKSTPKKKTWQDMHKVEKGETLFSIAKLYGLTENELLAENPDINPKKLKRGSFLFIPYKKGKSTEKNKENTVQPSNEELLRKGRKTSTNYNSLNVAVLLPFMTSDTEVNSDRTRMVEFYRGLLLAVDSLKTQGVSVNLHAYDTKQEENALERILSQPEIKQMQVIFGPVESQDISRVAAFAKENKIRLVVPFSSKVDPVFNSSLLYQVNTPQSYLYSEVYEHFMRKFTNAKVIFVDSHTEKEKAEFVRGLKVELRRNSIEYTDVVITPETKSEIIAQVMNPNKTNIFVPFSGSYKMLASIMPTLLSMKEENPTKEMVLFGYPEWQTYTKDFSNNFFALNTYFYSSFYTNTVFPEAIRFADKYKHWYKRDMAQTYPRYGMLGFDMGYFFLKGLSQKGSNIESSLDEIKVTPIQTGFKFERVSNWGGFINKKVFFVNFSPNKELIKLDFD